VADGPPWPLPTGITRLPEGVEWSPERRTFFRLDGTRVPGVGTILNDLGLRTYHEPEAMAEHHGVSVETARQFLFARGRAVDELTELLDAGRLDWETLDPHLVGYATAYQRFLDETGFVMLDAQRAVIEPTGLWWGYQDKRGVIGDQPLVLDVKRGSTQDGDFLQLAMYALADGDDPGRLILVLQPDGHYVPVPPPHPEQDDHVVRAAALVYRYRQAKRLT